MSKNYFSVVLCFLVFLAGCTPVQDKPVTYVDSSLMSQLEMSKSTKAETKALLGEPAFTTSKPDGRSTFLYNTSPTQKVVFLFDAEGKLIKKVVYEK